VRYVALIALVNFLVLLFLDDLVGYNLVGGAAGAVVISIFGIPFAIIVGFPILWLARKIRAGSAISLVPLGLLAGASLPFLITFLMGGKPDISMTAVGALLGVLSSALWWACVERFPERRAYYD